MTDLPLGKKEDLRLEFKSREALKKPEIIGREVVAMLNAEGGTVWVGFKDQDDQAVAVEAIPDAHRECQRLRDYLVDTIEPPPSGDDLKVEVVDTGDGDVIRVQTHPVSRRRPYAYLRGGARFFLKRIGDRTRPMTRDEILSFFLPQEPDRSAVQETVQKLVEEQHGIQERLRQTREEIFWLRLEPALSLALDLSALNESDLLIDPTLTSNSRTSPNFTHAYIYGRENPRIERGKLTVGKEGVFWLSVFRTGGLEFSAPLNAPMQKGEKFLWPKDILGYTVSTLNLLSRVYELRELWERDVPNEVEIVAHMALFNLKGWVLRPGSPATWVVSRYIGEEPRGARFNEDDFVLDQPVEFDLEALKKPGLCALRLIQRFYEAFGFPRDAIPAELDQKTGRLVLPE